ncbi:MAG: Gfo/Idh/MocA family oxidoreductase [Planctomycetes bacterium]|nr:Gfo/Idh/MocA family oxidoreductase [Planctomycetota bacterium]
MARTRLALVGCGGIARNHAQRFAAHTDRLKVVAAVDVRLEQARAVADLIDGAVAAEDYRDVLPDVDAVLLATPHQLHHAMAMDCLAAGKHVLLEKPLANTRSECLDLVAASQRSGTVLMVAYCMRYHPLLRRVKELLDARTYGEVFQMSIWTEQLTVLDSDNFGRWAMDVHNLGGGQLFSHGCHYIDLLMWYLGDPIEGVHVGTRTGTPWMTMEGTSNVALKFDRGVLAYHFGTWGARGSRLKYSLHAHCTDAMLEVDLIAGKLYAHLPQDKVELLAESPGGKPMEQEMSHFLDCIETGRRPDTNAAESLRGLEVIWKLYAAERQGVVARFADMPHPQSSFE